MPVPERASGLSWEPHRDSETSFIGHCKQVFEKEVKLNNPIETARGDRKQRQGVLTVSLHTY